jgi:putative acetyltransferase
VPGRIHRGCALTAARRRHRARIGSRRASVSLIAISPARPHVARHLDFAYSHSGAEHVHALSTDGLLDPAIAFFSYREGGQLLAVGALKQLEPGHAEIKSMHTAEVARGRGIGRAMLDHLIGIALQRAIRRLRREPV